MKKTIRKMLVLFTSILMAFSAIPTIQASAKDANEYTFDELAEMSIEELETVEGYEHMSEWIDDSIKNGCRVFTRYGILCNDEDQFLPTLMKTWPPGQHEVGSIYENGDISYSKLAEALGLSEKIIGNACIVHLDETTSHTGYYTAFYDWELDLNKVEKDMIYIEVNYEAYGWDNFLKTYLIFQSRLRLSEHISIFRPNIFFGTSVGYGDANCDGVVDISDAILVSRVAAEDTSVSLSETGRLNADCDGLSGISAGDASQIIQYIAKLI